MKPDGQCKLLVSVGRSEANSRPSMPCAAGAGAAELVARWRRRLRCAGSLPSTRHRRLPPVRAERPRVAVASSSQRGVVDLTAAWPGSICDGEFGTRGSFQPAGGSDSGYNETQNCPPNDPLRGPASRSSKTHVQKNHFPRVHVPLTADLSFVQGVAARYSPHTKDLGVPRQNTNTIGTRCAGLRRPA
jgi:hypothetical protein